MHFCALNRINVISTFCLLFSLFAKIISQYMDGIIDVRWPNVYRLIASKLSFVNLNFVAFFTATCAFKVNFIMTTIGQTMVPIVASFCIWVYCRVKCARIKSVAAVGMKEELARVNAQCTSVFLFVTYFVFPSTSCTIFRMYSCDSTFDYDASWLKADYAISCNQDLWQSMAYGCASHFSYNRTSPAGQLV
jgi:hypothetical protein